MKKREPQFYDDHVNEARQFFKQFYELGNKLYRKYHGFDQREAILAESEASPCPSVNTLTINTDLEMGFLLNKPPTTVAKIRGEQEKDLRVIVANKIIESVNQYEIEKYDSFELINAGQSAVLDALLPGRGVARVDWLPTIIKLPEPRPVVQIEDKFYEITIEETPEGPIEKPVEVDTDSVTKLGDGSFAITEDIGEERVQFRYWPYDCFIHNLADCWEDVTIVQYLHKMTPYEFEKKFGTEAATEEYNVFDERLVEMYRKPSYSGVSKRCHVMEAWDKETGEIVWYSQKNKKEYQRTTPTVNFKDFFNCPRPLYFQKNLNRLEPIPKYANYHGTVSALNQVRRQRFDLIDTLVAITAYDKAFEADARKIFGDSSKYKNALVPVDMDRMNSSGGLNRIFQSLDISGPIQALEALRNEEMFLSQNLDQQSGISDILRGQSNPNDTATAQTIKEAYGSMPLNERKREVSRFIKDLVCLSAEIVCEKFKPTTLMAKANVLSFSEEEQGVVEEAIELLRNDAGRRVEMDIETDSTVILNEKLLKDDFNEFLGTVLGAMGSLLPMLQQYPPFFSFVSELLQRGVKLYSMGRGVEQEVARAMEQIKQSIEEQSQSQEPSSEEKQMQMATDLKMQEFASNERIAEGKSEVEVAHLLAKLQQFMQEYQLEKDKLSNENQNTIRAQAQGALRNVNERRQKDQAILGKNNQ